MGKNESVKEVTRLIREARKRWDAHENAACRRLRDRALSLYEELSKSDREGIPETHRVWLRYRSEKYFGPQRTQPGTKSGTAKKKEVKEKKKSHAPKHSVAWCRIDSPVGSLTLLASKKGLSGVYFGHRMEKSTLPKREDREFPYLKKAAKQLGEYFAGEREEFDLPLDAKGSEFQRDVWRNLSGIQYGEVISYGELARRLGDPKAVRAVGVANGANPISIIVPCHRVIGANGDLIGFGGGLDIKRKLLQLEGFLLPGI